MSLINAVLRKVDFTMFEANSEDSGDYIVVDFRILRIGFHIGFRTSQSGGPMQSNIEIFDIYRIV